MHWEFAGRSREFGQNGERPFRHPALITLLQTKRASRHPSTGSLVEDRSDFAKHLSPRFS